MVDIIFKNHAIVAVNKPHGLSVHQDTEDVGLTQMLAQELGVEQVWLVHRLDKATSGVLLFALDAQTASDLGRQFADKKIHKTYLALSDRKPSKKQGWVKGDMEKSRNGSWKLSHSMQQPAVTRFHSHSLAPKLRLFILYPHTGKTHQLRVAMKSLGSPILGDTRYQGTEAERMFLHAWKIHFEYQSNRFEITAPWDQTWPSESIHAVLSTQL